MRSFLNNCITLVFKPKLAVWIFFGFVAFTIIGTLTHEMGHIAVAKVLGYKTTLHYGSMNFDQGEVPDDIKEIALRNKEAIASGIDFLGKDKWEEIRKQRRENGFWVHLGGPLQTILTGTIGFLILYRRKPQIQTNGIKLMDWFLIFLSLFWLRELSNFVQGMITGDNSPFSGRSDEIRLARSLGWWEGSISLPLAIVALIIALYVIFKIIPVVYRLTFIAAGFTGGVFGFLFWLKWVGPVVLP